MKAQGLIEDAVIAGEGQDSEPLVLFLRRQWNYDSGPYVREKLDYSHNLTRRHCEDQLGRLSHWTEFFGEDYRLRDLRREKLVDFQHTLKAKKRHGKTINNILGAGLPVISWAQKRGILAADPGEGLRKYAEPSEKRGILTPDELKAIFAPETEWYDERARVGALVAATCGLRSGEVLALRGIDIGIDRLMIEHSWSRSDGLKLPKTNESRTVPLLPQRSGRIDAATHRKPMDGRAGSVCLLRPRWSG